MPLALAGATSVAMLGLAAVLEVAPPRGGGTRLLGFGEIWLLGVFTAGVLALLLGAAVAADRGVPGLRSRLARAPEEPGRPEVPVAGVAVRTGGWLLLVYVAGWVILG
jgi:hypothetical protein